MHDPKEIRKYDKEMTWTKQVVHVRPVEDGLAAIFDGCDKGNHGPRFSPFLALCPGLWGLLTPWS